MSGAEARVSVLDRGLLFGDGVFETLRAYGGIVFRLERHLDRLRLSMEGLSLHWPFELRVVRREIDELLEAGGLADARIRLTVTGGMSDGRIRLARTNPPTVILHAEPLVPPSPETYRNGIDLAIARFRQPWHSPLARIKTIHRLEYLMAREEAIARNATDALILDDRGQVAEGSSSNLAFVLEGRVVTPSLDCPILPGVTREAMLEAARDCGLATEERVVTLDDLGRADEVLATATSWEVLAIRSVDGRPVGGGRPGPLTRRIHDAFRKLVIRETTA